MTAFLPVFVLIPAIGFCISLILPRHHERLIAGLTFAVVTLQLLAVVILGSVWLYQGHPVTDIKEIVLYRTAGYEFFIDLYVDRITMVYLVVGTILAFLVIRYSHHYLHRERGYKRFFYTILFFFTGYNLTICAGNLETLFIGWEILGVSSFLLIAFYRNRYLPVKHAVKVFSIYRIGDVGILLAMWMSHHLWHENITFQQLLNYERVHEHLAQHSWTGTFISLMLLLAAAAKSAQLPFSSWLPRAMEGPTPSSAIFYGSLSVHIGVFLMLRTFPFWEHQHIMRVATGLLGLTTALVTTGIARVQTSAKSQIAYASIAQIGLMFIEIALGWRHIALFHFAGNAFLRTYQLLISPSIVSYRIREQFYEGPQPGYTAAFLPPRLRLTLYILSLKEWNLDSLMYRLLWNPLKWAGNRLNFLTHDRVLTIVIPAYLLGVASRWYEAWLPGWLRQGLPVLFAAIGLMLVLKSFTARHKVRMSWLLILMNHYWIALAISFNEYFEMEHTLLYLSGITLAGLTGYLCLAWLNRRESLDLARFHGHIYEYAPAAMIFLLACLGITGFPITPSCIGEDLILSHIHEDQLLLAGVVALGLIVDGLAAIRIYARIFMGPHIKTYHPSAYRSA
ncbi:MAG: proton-conducting transporter membrane subunit [Bacteroidia bacterium]|nr:proton-conducting transporter membrane subunit [Bacteroidia bacterium]